MGVLLVWVVSIVSITICFGVWLLSIVALKFCVCIGPIAVACLGFPLTKGIFDRWLGTCLASAMSAVMVSAVLVVMQFGQALTTDNVIASAGQAGGNSITELQALLADCVVIMFGAVFCRQVPTLAAAIFNGVALSVSPYSSAMASAGRGAAAAGHMAGAAARGTVSAGKAAGNMLLGPQGRAPASNIRPPGRSLSGGPP